MTISSLSRWYMSTATQRSVILTTSQFFSVALAITNIVGATIGGFGVDFTKLDEAEITVFLKVSYLALSSTAGAKLTLKNHLDPICHAILVHLCRGRCQAICPLLLWSYLFRDPLAESDMDHDGAHSRMAYQLLLRDPLPSLADFLQLDTMSCRDYELSGHVCLQQCDRYCS